LFDKIVSRCAFRKLNDRLLESQVLYNCTMTWLLVTKISIERNTPSGSLTAALRRAAQSMVYWKACNSKSSVCEEEYWNTVCAVAVAYQGKNWACQQLKSSFDDSSGLSSRQTDCPTHHDALPVAAYRGDRSTVQTLLKKGADMNASSGCLGYALYAAVYRGNTDIVGVLLEHGANLSIEGVLGTPLQVAAYHDYGQVARLLLTQCNIDPNLKNSRGQTPLLLAAKVGNLAITQLLLERDDIQPNLSDDEGDTPLWWAAFRGHITIVQLLLERQDIVRNPKNNRGGTPLDHQLNLFIAFTVRLNASSIDSL
jgi:hypothetical protein